MDRDRLKQVHQTDLTESHINEDFVEWLKTKGPSWLLFLLIGIAAYMGIIRWKQHKGVYEQQGWSEFLTAELPGTFEDVASQYSDIDSLPQQAWRRAADTLLRSVQSGRRLGTDPGSADPESTLTDEQQQEYLDRADRLYEAVLETDDQSLAMTLHAVSAMKGRAVVAEARGDVEQAKYWYEQAAQRAEPYYADLAQRARSRAESVDRYAEPITLPTQQQLSERPSVEPLQPAVIEDVLRDLLLPDEGGNG